jgi:hypothetical protein
LKKEEVTTNTTSTTTTTTFDEDPNFDRKLDLVTEGARSFIKEHLLTRITRDSCNIIINYIIVFQTETNPSEKYRIEILPKLPTRLCCDFTLIFIPLLFNPMILQ